MGSIMWSLMIFIGILIVQVCGSFVAESSYAPRRVVVDRSPAVHAVYASHEGHDYAGDVVYEPEHAQRVVVVKQPVTVATQYVQPAVHMEPVHVNSGLRVEHVYQPEVAHTLGKSVKLYKRPVTSLKRPIVSYKVPVDSYAQFVDGADYGYESRYGEIGPLATTGRYSQFVGKPSRVLFRMADYDSVDGSSYEYESNHGSSYGYESNHGEARPLAKSGHYSLVVAQA